MRSTSTSPRAEAQALAPRTRRRTSTALAGAAAAAIGALAPASPARADFSFSEPLRNQKDEGFCIGIDGASKESGAGAMLFRCVGTGNQAHLLAGSRFDFRIVNSNSKFCLRIKENSAANGAQVVQGSCDSKSAHWRLVNLLSFGDSSSRLASLQNHHTGKCIGVSGGHIFHGAVIQVFNCGMTDFGNGNWVVNQNRRLMP